MWQLCATMSWVGWWVDLIVYYYRLSATKYMKVKRMAIAEILGRLWLFSANKIKALNLLVNNHLNSSLRHIRNCNKECYFRKYCIWLSTAYLLEMVSPFCTKLLVEFKHLDNLSSYNNTPLEKSISHQFSFLFLLWDLVQKCLHQIFFCQTIGAQLEHLG